MKKAKYVTLAAALVLGSAPAIASVVPMTTPVHADAVSDLIQNNVANNFKTAGSVITENSTNYSKFANTAKTLYDLGNSSDLAKIGSSADTNASAHAAIGTAQTELMKELYKDKNAVITSASEPKSMFTWQGYSNRISNVKTVVNGKNSDNGERLLLTELTNNGSFDISFDVTLSTGATFQTPTLRIQKTNYALDLSQVGNIHVLPGDPYIIQGKNGATQPGITVTNDEGTVVKNVLALPAGASLQDYLNKLSNNSLDADTYFSDLTNANAIHTYNAFKDVTSPIGGSDDLDTLYSKFGEYNDAVDIYVKSDDTGTVSDYTLLQSNVGRKTFVDVPTKYLPQLNMTEGNDVNTYKSGDTLPTMQIQAGTPSDEAKQGILNNFLGTTGTTENPGVTAATLKLFNANPSKVSVAWASTTAYPTEADARSILDAVDLSKDDINIDYSNVDFSKAGTYNVPVTIKALTSGKVQFNTLSDSNDTIATKEELTEQLQQIYDNGAVSTFTVPVVVTDPGAPVITFTQNGQNMTINKGESFSPFTNLKVYPWSGNNSWTNQSNSDVNISVSGSVDTNVAGVYNLIYTATNSAGRVTKLTRTITVLDNGTSVESPEYSTLDTVGTVDYVPGYGIRVYTEPNNKDESAGTEQYLPHGTAWKVLGKAVYDDGTTFYQVGAHQWVRAYLNFDGGVSNETTVEMNGVATIEYVPGYGINLWGDSALQNFSGTRLQHGTAWKVFAKTTHADGTVAYNVGRNQWIDGRYVQYTSN